MLTIASHPPARPAAASILVDDRDLPTPIAIEIARQHKHNKIAALATLGEVPEPYLIVIKRPNPSDPRSLMQSFGAAARALLRERLPQACVTIPRQFQPDTALPIVLGLSRGSYRFDRYKSKPGLAHQITIVSESAAWRRAAERAISVADGVNLCRDLVNTPAEDMGPDELEGAARSVARRADLKIRVWDHKRCEQAGMGALLAVGRASPRAPRMIVLEHRGAPGRKDWLALCGKGICFDTGGLDIKSADGMLLMKKDMGGAATVLGAALAVGLRRPKRNVRWYLAIAENSIAGNAIRPGDIVRAMDGTTIEIGNTDAEGRLVLADAVCLAVKEGATRIVDAATLTGAALIALGRARVPLISNDDRLAAALEQSAEQVGERVWRMPHDDDYKEQIKGKLADLKNVGKGSEAGVMAGGLFIGHFAAKVAWAHLDISPASWADGENDLGPDGATGTMVATLTHLAGAC